ncbi:MAG: hypothetical protein EHM31_12385 [Candidatus Aminicenantes bacterium]|nr:MAG: hypothetical protein EHM31_12385 [Candidatus Aminicenantes bacterium]
MMPPHFAQDVQDLIFLLFKHKVRFVIVGAEAVIFHGFARLTGDVDIFYEPSLENRDHLFLALTEFWGGKIPGIKTVAALAVKGTVVQFGYPPNRIDLINEISGVGFPEAWKGRRTQIHMIKQMPLRVPYIGLSALIKNKKACGRPKDLEDLKYLEEKARQAKSRSLRRS